MSNCSKDIRSHDWPSIDIDCEGKLIPVHPHLLATMSPVFQAMFLGEFNEAQQIQQCIKQGSSPGRHSEAKKERRQSSSSDQSLPRLFTPECSSSVGSNKRRVLHLKEVSARAFELIVDFAYNSPHAFEPMNGDVALESEVLNLIQQFDLSTARLYLLRVFYKNASPCKLLNVTETLDMEQEFSDSSAALFGANTDMTTLINWKELKPVIKIAALKKGYRFQLKERNRLLSSSYHCQRSHEERLVQRLTLKDVRHAA